MSRLEEERQVFKNALKSVDNWDALATTLGCYPGMLEKRVEELEEQLQAIFFTMVEVDNMKIKLERYKHALEFYANDENWVAGNWFTPVDIDQGEIAEKALAGDNS